MGTRFDETERWSTRSGAATAFLVLVAATFLAPKVLLLDFYRGLWVEPTPGLVAVALLQDVAVAALVFAIIDASLAAAPPRRFALLAVASSSLLVVLMLDARVRELWLQPISRQVIRYAWQERADLRSGLPLFLQFNAGWGMTFRRALVVVVAVHGLLWVGLAFAARRVADRRLPPRPGGWRRPTGAATLSFCLLVAASQVGGQQRYRLQDNLLTGAVVAQAWATPANALASDAAAAFDQKPVPAMHGLALPRTILKDARPFRNLVLVFLESVRWRDLGLEGGNSPFPTLRRLAREGLTSRCSVHIPHSSKGYFAVLSGRYPFPGVEMRESQRFVQDSLFGALQREFGMRTYAFASLNLGFENTRGMLSALGIEKQFQVQDLAREQGHDVRQVSSFGYDDDQLYSLGAAFLKREGGAFAAVFLPVGAHYPYDYPGKPADQGATHGAYLESLAATDRLLGDLLSRFLAAGLAEDTLFVLVGDHGESFGERGLWVHNSSLYDEEVTVPLVLWSTDGRLDHEGVVAGRQIDVAPTVLDLFGATSATISIQGVSLLRPGPPPPAYFSTFYDDLAIGLREGASKYILEIPADRLLHFDLASDPEERDPLPVSASSREAVVARLRAFQAFQRAAHP